MFVIAAYLLWVPARLWPQDFGDATEWRVAAHWFFFMVEVFTEYVGLILLAIVVAAAWRRLWKLGLVAVPLMLLTFGPVAWCYVPDFSPQAAAGDSIRVMSVNLLWMNEQTGPTIAEIRTADADLILMQEYAPHWHQALERELATEYPHRVAEPREDAFGAAIYSRLPFKEARLLNSMGTRELPQISIVVELGGRDVAVYNVHLLPPIRLEYVMARNSQFAAMLDELADEALPVVLAGDFNFTHTSPHARALTATGLTDAHDLGGYGRGATWPVNGVMRYLPILGFRIDHIYLSDALTCTAIRTGIGAGSDHRPLIATIALR